VTPRGSATASARSASPPHPVPAGITIREPTELELDAAGEVVRAAYLADGHAASPYLDLIADARARARDAEIAVAVDDAGDVVGSVTFALPGSPWAEVARAGEAEFRMLGVVPSRRGTGIGAALLEWCVARAQALGRERLVLYTTPSMKVAHRLYLRRGFTRRPELDSSPVPGVELLAFALELAGAPGRP
jgi:GNAT superfamily N-acetyltransferase